MMPEFKAPDISRYRENGDHFDLKILHLVFLSFKKMKIAFDWILKATYTV